MTRREHFALAAGYTPEGPNEALDKNPQLPYIDLIMFLLTTKPVIEARKGFWHGYNLDQEPAL